jgi:hypothetical protein
VWRGVSLVAAWGLGACSIALLLRGGGVSWFWIEAAWVGLASTCLLSGLARAVILDFLSQFQYREKFALFLAHVVMVAAPIGLFGTAWFRPGLALVAIALGLQLVIAVNFHRYLALCALMSVVGFQARPAGAALWGFGWCFLAATYLLVERVRFALEDAQGAPLAIAPSGALRMMGMYIVAPLLVAGAVAWWVPAPKAKIVEPPAGSYAGGAPGGTLRIEAVDVTRLMWQAMGLATTISVLIGFLYWYSARQAKKKGRQPELKELLVAAESEAIAPAPPPATLDSLEGRESRFEVFRQFRRLERALARFDLARRRSCTAKEYLRGLAPASVSPSAPAAPPSLLSSSSESDSESPLFPSSRLPASEPLIEIYNKARYGEDDPSAEEVENFRRGVGRLIDEAKRRSQDRPSKHAAERLGKGKA